MGGGSLPVGTVTFLRTDVEGSMRWAQSLGPLWDEINATHLDLIRRAVTGRGGVVVRTEGDAVFAAFADAGAAARTALEVQRAVGEHPWPGGARLRVRIGLHSGEAHLAGDDYGGMAVNRAARVAAVGHGGQIVLSEATRALVVDDMPDGATIRALGAHRLKGAPRPEDLFQLVAEGLESHFPPLETEKLAGRRLPARLTSPIGRDEDLARLAEMLDGTRLLTITGPGGVGKTTMALELARSTLDHDPEGVAWVSLAGISEASLVPNAVARVLGVRDAGDRPVLEGVTRLLADGAMLLVLDNMEHVLDAAPAVVELLGAAPGLRVLATSRAPLRVAGEQEYPLSPLAADGPHALRLFEVRARAIVPDWSAERQKEVVRDICRLVDGLPLGIELVASRVALLPLPALRERLAAGLPVPGAGRRDAPERQRTLEGAVRWSYDLLDEPTRRLLRALAAFERGFDLDQVSQVVDGSDREVMDGLDQLAEFSLLVPIPSQQVTSTTASGVRFGLLETVRAFALAKLAEAGELASVRSRHTEAYLALAQAAASYLPGRETAAWLDRLALDHDNLHSAAAWAVEIGAVATAQRLVAALWRYWQLCGHLREGRVLADAALALPGAGPERIGALDAAAGLAYWQGDTARAKDLYRQQLTLARALNDRQSEADAAMNLWTIVDNDDPGDQRARGDLLALAAQRYAETGDQRGLARATFGRTILDIQAGAAQDPIASLKASAERFARLGDSLYQRMAVGIAGMFLHNSGRTREAVPRIAWSLRANWGSRDLPSTAITLLFAAAHLNALSAPEEAATLLGAWQKISDVQGYDLPDVVRLMLPAVDPREQAAAALTLEAYARAFDRGAAMTADVAVGFALEALERSAAAAERGGHGTQTPP